MKKIISVILTAVFVLCALPAMADGGDSDVMTLLSELNIMVGDSDGNMRLEDYVSRAEFAKIAVNASSFKNTVAAGMKISPFRDVTYSHWSAPYVKAAVSAGIAEGYLDASFRPDNTVSYEEAITMILKVLGYTNDDFGASWPYGQIGLADNLDITEDVNSYMGEPLTRRQVARLVYNALNTKMKDSPSKLMSVFDCEIIEDVTVIASHNEDSSLAEDKIFTTSGTFEIKDSFNFDNVGRKGDIIVKNGTAVSFKPNSSDKGALEKYVIYSQLSGSVIGYKNGVFSQIDLADGTDCYKDGMKSTYAAVKNGVEMGDILYVRRVGGGTVDYVTYEKGSMEGPVKVTDSGWTDRFPTNASTAFMRDGNKVSPSDIKVNDIIYYSEDLNMVLAYTTKVTGVYENALPTKDNPTSVVISGKEYGVEGVAAFNALSSSGNLRYGDTITVLIGRGGDIAGVAGADTATTTSSVGYVLAAGRKNFENADKTSYSSYYAQIVTPDGSVNEYASKSDCKSYVGKVCTVSFSNGTVSLRRQNSSTVSGLVDSKSYTIGSNALADNVKILDTVVSDVYDAVLYKSIYPQRLDGMNLTSSKVMYCGRNSEGEISELILNNATGDAYTYGVAVSKSRMGNGYLYTLDADGVQYSYSTTRDMQSQIGYRITQSGGQTETIDPLSRYSGTFSELTDTYAVIGNKKYKLSDKVLVYKKTSSLMKIPLTEAIEGTYKRMTAYYDRTEDSGGRIRVIIVEE